MRIMVVDDEEFCIAAMESMLELAGIDVKNQVDFCIHGQEAVDKLQQSYQLGFQYSIIFTDFNMPIMDGIDATRCMREIMFKDMKL